MRWQIKNNWWVNGALTLFVLANGIAFFHAYQFTHFEEAEALKTKSPRTLSSLQKLKTLLFGVSNPKPIPTKFPSLPYTTVLLQSNKKIACWDIPVAQAKGTVVLFHGYGGEKSDMLGYAQEFIAMGYETLLVDFMGSGESEGNETTIGAKEAENVKTAYEYVKSRTKSPVYLFGVSMGAVAILKALHDDALQPDAIILECPYGSLYKTTCARFKNMGVPSFPLAGFLDFWGGAQNGFWAFSVVPIEYAKSVTCPTLLLYGEKDVNVSKEETDDIFRHLAGPKQLKTFPLAGHENYLLKYRKEWVKQVNAFLKEQDV